MKTRFSHRMTKIHRSFIREILQVTEKPDVISFAGGLPKPDLFPVTDLKRALDQVLDQFGSDSLQYSNTEGYLPLRKLVAGRYKERWDLDIPIQNVLITSGSQQGLDLLGKVLIDPGDGVLMERPGYLGALQAFSLFEPEIRAAALEGDGPDLSEVEKLLGQGDIKMFYAVPNFQNPSGQSYSLEKRRAVAEMCLEAGVLFAEDDPYGELRYRGEDLPPVFSFLGGEGVLMGSFSKIGVPGFRLGWVVAPGDVVEKLVTAKQAADLHTSTFAQCAAHAYMSGADLGAHIEELKQNYGLQMDVMVTAMQEHFPDVVSFTRPEGGMFLWVTLPEGVSSMELFDLAIEYKVAFVPGKPFYHDGSGDNSFRLNFSNSTPEMIEEGIRRLGVCIDEMLSAP
jgi:2-aminoadipate transaminase